jgi:MbtH protein
MPNPFEQDDRSYHVLINDEGQYSLWPATNDTPAGWTVVLADKPREECLAHVEANWTDMRPKSLARR